MEFLAVIGWLVMMAVGIWLCGSSIIIGWVGRAFGGGRGESALCAGIFVGGAAIITLGFWLAPIEVSMR